MRRLQLMANVAGLGNSNVTFGLSNSPAVNFTMQSSTNLILHRATLGFKGGIPLGFGI
jgi:hypothetical protein